MSHGCPTDQMLATNLQFIQLHSGWTTPLDVAKNTVGGKDAARSLKASLQSAESVFSQLPQSTLFRKEELRPSGPLGKARDEQSHSHHEGHTVGHALSLSCSKPPGSGAVSIPRPNLSLC